MEGLAGGLQALVVKMHHAAMDGVSGAELVAAWLDSEADPTPEVDDTGSWQPERLPSEIELLIGAWAELASSPAKMARTTRRVTEAAMRVSQHNSEAGTTPPPAPFSAPRTPFNLAITPHRRACFGEVALDDLKAVKNHFGCTVNDVVLVLCAGALRRYLLTRNELPTEPLSPLCRCRCEPTRSSSGGNRLSAMLTSLATDSPTRSKTPHDLRCDVGRQITGLLIGADF